MSDRRRQRAVRHLTLLVTTALTGLTGEKRWTGGHVGGKPSDESAFGARSVNATALVQRMLQHRQSSPNWGGVSRGQLTIADTADRAVLTRVTDYLSGKRRELKGLQTVGEAEVARMPRSTDEIRVMALNAVHSASVAAGVEAPAEGLVQLNFTVKKTTLLPAAVTLLIGFLANEKWPEDIMYARFTLSGSSPNRKVYVTPDEGIKAILKGEVRSYVCLPEYLQDSSLSALKIVNLIGTKVMRPIISVSGLVRYSGFPAFKRALETIS